MLKRFLPIVTLGFWGIVSVVSIDLASAENLQWARVQTVKNQVRLLLEGKPPREAKNNDRLEPNDALTTGRKSRAELRFSDRSLARLGELAMFKFVPNTRNFRLDNGTTLLLIPPGKGRTRVITPNATAGIRGSALFVRYSPDTNTTIVGALTNSQIEVTNQDGTQTAPLQAGQLAIIVQNQIVRIASFDLNRFYQTSPLAEGLDLTQQNSTDEAIAAVQAETTEAVSSQAPLDRSAITTNPDYLQLRSSSVDPYEGIAIQPPGVNNPVVRHDINRELSEGINPISNPTANDVASRDNLPPPSTPFSSGDTAAVPTQLGTGGPPSSQNPTVTLTTPTRPEPVTSPPATVIPVTPRPGPVAVPLPPTPTRPNPAPIAAPAPLPLPTPGTTGAAPAPIAPPAAPLPPAPPIAVIPPPTSPAPTLPTVSTQGGSTIPAFPATGGPATPATPAVPAPGGPATPAVPAIPPAPVATIQPPAPLPTPPAPAAPIVPPPPIVSTPGSRPDPTAIAAPPAPIAIPTAPNNPAPSVSAPPLPPAPTATIAPPPPTATIVPPPPTATIAPPTAATPITSPQPVVTTPPISPPPAPSAPPATPVVTITQPAPVGSLPVAPTAPTPALTSPTPPLTTTTIVTPPPTTSVPPPVTTISAPVTPVPTTTTPPTTGGTTIPATGGTTTLPTGGTTTPPTGGTTIAP